MRQMRINLLAYSVTMWLLIIIQIIISLWTNVSWFFPGFNVGLWLGTFLWWWVHE